MKQICPQTIVYLILYINKINDWLDKTLPVTNEKHLKTSDYMNTTCSL